VAANPLLFQLKEVNNTFLALPYRMWVAIGSIDSVTLYDTQTLTPKLILVDSHYAPITDLSWSPDGFALMISSMDGFCTVLSFTTTDLGEPLSKPKQDEYLKFVLEARIPLVHQTENEQPKAAVKRTFSEMDDNDMMLVDKSPAIIGPQDSILYHKQNEIETPSKKKKITPTLISPMMMPKPGSILNLDNDPPKQKKRIAPILLSSPQLDAFHTPTKISSEILPKAQERMIQNQTGTMQPAPKFYPLSSLNYGGSESLKPVQMPLRTLGDLSRMAEMNSVQPLTRVSVEGKTQSPPKHLGFNQRTLDSFVQPKQ